MMAEQRAPGAARSGSAGGRPAGRGHGTCYLVLTGVDVIVGAAWIPNGLGRRCRKAGEGSMAGRGGLIAWLIVCYAFLYLPIAFLIGFSFNDSRSVTAWSGFSFRWYRVLFHDEAMLG